MKSKIINRVRAREAHYQRKKAADLELEQMWDMWANTLRSIKERQEQSSQGDNHISLVKQTLAYTFKQPTRHWWQFWK